VLDSLAPSRGGFVAFRGPWMGARGECPSIAVALNNTATEVGTYQFTSAYGFSSCIEKSEAVAAWNFAAADDLPTFPGSLQHPAETES
jgi:hypothetical protein